MFQKEHCPSLVISILKIFGPKKLALLHEQLPISKFTKHLKLKFVIEKALIPNVSLTSTDRAMKTTSPPEKHNKSKIYLISEHDTL
jgi:hypothetical protein